MMMLGFVVLTVLRGQPNRNRKDMEQDNGDQPPSIEEIHRRFSAEVRLPSSRNSRLSKKTLSGELASEIARLPSPRQPEFRRTLAELGTFLSPMNYGNS
jgi:hypothetical protein